MAQCVEKPWKAEYQKKPELVFTWEHEDFKNLSEAEKFCEVKRTIGVPCGVTLSSEAWDKIKECVESKLPKEILEEKVIHGVEGLDQRNEEILATAWLWSKKAWWEKPASIPVVFNKRTCTCRVRF
jgi:hypothetical protein